MLRTFSMVVRRIGMISGDQGRALVLLLMVPLGMR
jgi:hypothetical protein